MTTAAQIAPVAPAAPHVGAGGEGWRWWTTDGETAHKAKSPRRPKPGGREEEGAGGGRSLSADAIGTLAPSRLERLDVVAGLLHRAGHKPAHGVFLPIRSMISWSVAPPLRWSIATDSAVLLRTSSGRLPHAGASERSIMNQTGHRSTTMLRRYIRDASLFRENVSGRVGL
jgi:hypothetical protein